MEWSPDPLEYLHDILFRSAKEGRRQNGQVRQFGKYVASIRSGMGLTQAQLASEVGVSRSALAQVESGRSVLSVRALRALLAALSMDPFEWMDEEDRQSVDILYVATRFAAQTSQDDAKNWFRLSLESISRESLLALIEMNIAQLESLLRQKYKDELWPDTLDLLGDYQQWPTPLLRLVASWVTFAVSGDSVSLRRLLFLSPAGSATRPWLEDLVDVLNWPESQASRLFALLDRIPPDQVGRALAGLARFVPQD